jgi:hypothetical protein
MVNILARVLEQIHNKIFLNIKNILNTLNTTAIQTQDT